MTLNLREMLEDHWQAVAHRPIKEQGRMQTAELPVIGETGTLLAAVDATGARHLLIPLKQNESLPATAEGNLRWQLRGLEDSAGYRRYADLGCYRESLNDVFAGLCSDILVAVESVPTRPLKTARLVVERWRSLFEMGGGPPLGVERLSGLFGELLVLRRLLRHHGDAARLWSGPTGHCHDFTAPERSIEVKASLASESRRIRVHGLDQLEEPTDGHLYLVWLRLERSSAGQSMPELVEEVTRLSDNEHDLLARLSAGGYHAKDGERYVEIRFRAVEERWYRVTDEFPRLVTASFGSGGPPPVVDVHYTLDLMPDPVLPMTEELIETSIVQMTKSLL